jgi:D-arabinose 1-dehydrogenase-like Zn-dependent alcohol dehydrogenase
MLFSYICDQFKFLRLMVYLKLWTEIFQNPSGGQVRIKVQACGICHCDSITKQGLFQGIQYPRVPGHEVAGIINEVIKMLLGGNLDRESP